VIGLKFVSLQGYRQLNMSKLMIHRNLRELLEIKIPTNWLGFFIR